MSWVTLSVVVYLSQGSLAGTRCEDKDPVVVYPAHLVDGPHERRGHEGAEGTRVDVDKSPVEL